MEFDILWSFPLLSLRKLRRRPRDECCRMVADCRNCFNGSAASCVDRQRSGAQLPRRWLAGFSLPTVIGSLSLLSYYLEAVIRLGYSSLRVSANPPNFSKIDPRARMWPPPELRRPSPAPVRGVLESARVVSGGPLGSWSGDPPWLFWGFCSPCVPRAHPCLG